MENVYENVRRELTPENVKDVLQVMLERVHLPENEAKIMSAKEQAGDDMVEVMKTVFPMVLEIQIEVIGKFGYVSTQEGLKDFLIRVNQLTTEHKEILDLLIKIRETYLPGFNQKGNCQPQQQECSSGGGGGSNNSTGLASMSSNNPTNGPSSNTEELPVVTSIGGGGSGSGGKNSNVGSVGSGGKNSNVGSVGSGGKNSNVGSVGSGGKNSNVGSVGSGGKNSNVGSVGSGGSGGGASGSGKDSKKSGASGTGTSPVTAVPVPSEEREPEQEE